MFWGCFSWDYKGPCHCWKAKTKKEKEDAAIKIAEMNVEKEPEARLEWELETGTECLRIANQNIPGRKPQWVFSEKTGKYVRSATRGGIDWWRYRTIVLEPLLLPFAKECNMKQEEKGKLPMIVQEDKAPSHSSKYQDKVFSTWEIMRLIWLGNSPDLNMIEPCWPWMKRSTCEKGPPCTREEAEILWKEWWEKLLQSKIQCWIAFIPRHLRIIRYLNGDNKYKEGRIDGHTGTKKGRRLLAELEAEMATLEAFESLSLEEQEQRITNPEDSDSDDYNLSDFELDDEFDMDFGEDDEKEEDNINQNHPVFYLIVSWRVIFLNLIIHLLNMEKLLDQLNTLPRNLSK